jgi:hypothetical protein
MMADLFWTEAIVKKTDGLRDVKSAGADAPALKFCR